jgi:hypothetical protein
MSVLQGMQALSRGAAHLAADRVENPTTRPVRLWFRSRSLEAAYMIATLKFSLREPMMGNDLEFFQHSSARIGAYQVTARRADASRTEASVPDRWQSLIIAPMSSADITWHSMPVPGTPVCDPRVVESQGLKMEFPHVEFVGGWSREYRLADPGLPAEAATTEKPTGIAPSSLWSAPSIKRDLGSPLPNISDNPAAGCGAY